ncbi:MAG: nucleotidyl transferase AbiEii/AbiGii toxin family protein [Bacteroidetes bacterium]|nr:nucleotidyl transferase AbiEii/AbiGii toxin family protein [Bacteroidota bacterium]
MATLWERIRAIVTSQSKHDGGAVGAVARVTDEAGPPVGPVPQSQPEASAVPAAKPDGIPPGTPATILIPEPPFEPSDYPQTYLMSVVDAGAAKQVRLFEPALKHFMRAFRFGEPEFADSVLAQRWYATRTRVIEHLLRVVGESEWCDHLVLRGSVLMKTWFGSSAREPGDIDWVVIPASIELADLRACRIVQGLISAVNLQSDIGDGYILVDEVTMDDIWTYERAQGRRIVFPWSAPGLPRGSVQMDIVFGEKLPRVPMPAQIPISDGRTISLQSAAKELALVWKLLWLETDSYPQGKDLYDAVLLAEQTVLPRWLLDQVLGAERYGRIPPPVKPDFPLQWEVDWENFIREYPWVEGDAAEWQMRLRTALAPTFDGMQPPEGSRTEKGA